MNSPIHPDATRLVTPSLQLIDARLRNNPEANRLFLEILTSRNSPEVVLRRMNEAGVLGRFIPEFGRVVAMMQFNMYHHYTVDEHLLRAIGMLAELEPGRLEGRACRSPAKSCRPSATGACSTWRCSCTTSPRAGPRTIRSPAPTLARKLGPRLGLDDAETERVAWLVEHHLLMSTIGAEPRPRPTPRTIETFAAMVQTLERLKMLLVLTVCDIRAVGPGVWNGWKGQLLRTLYWETEIVLAGGHSAIDRKQRVERAQDELRARCRPGPIRSSTPMSARHYPAYWLKVDLPHKIKHAQLLYACGGRDAIAGDRIRDRRLSRRHRTHRRRARPSAPAVDHRRRLRRGGANIVDAQIFTTTDGLALDTIFVSRAFDRDEDELRRAARVAKPIEQALRGEIRVTELLAAKARTAPDRAETFSVPPEVIIDNSLSRQIHRDRGLRARPAGLLYDLTTPCRS